MSFKKFDGNIWQPITPKQLKGIPYTGTLPATLTGTKAGYLHRYKIYGNTEQIGTPTPENPIVPQECGERTEQLFDISSITLGKWYTNSGDLQNQAYGAISEMNNINEEHLTIKWHGSKPYSFSYVWFDINKDFISRSHYGGYSGLDDEYTNTVPSNAVYYILQMSNDTSTSNPITIEQITSFQTMLNSGSTALPYEPYGYKLPLTSAGQNVDIYIGDDTLSTEEYVDYQEQKVYKRTEQLFDENTITINQSINYATGVPFPSQSSYLSDYIDINDAVALSILISNTSGVIASQSNRGWCYFDAELNFISGITWVSRTTTSTTFTVNSIPENAKYLRFSIDKNIDAITLIEGSTAPASYIPYLQPTDPPVPFPNIPTSAGSTTISWAGEGLAPSELDSIQEWVDIPTYKRVNGEWVADN